jgi:hypothetical protein
LHNISNEEPVLRGTLWFLLFTACTIFAQVEPPLNQQVPDKPSLFANLPEKFECNLTQLQKLFSDIPPQKVLLKLNSAFQVDGVIAEKFTRSERLTSINIRLNNYDDALFNLSRITEKDGITYTGRIVSIKHGDVLLLTKEKDKYYFVRQQRKFVMVE